MRREGINRIDIVFDRREIKSIDTWNGLEDRSNEILDSIREKRVFRKGIRVGLNTLIGGFHFRGFKGGSAHKERVDDHSNGPHIYLVTVSFPSLAASSG